MRPIHLAQRDKVRPVVILTREYVRAVLHKVTIIPITGRIRGLQTEVLLGPQNGLHKECVASCDNIETILSSDLGRHIGFLLTDQEPALTRAIHAAFSLTDIDGSRVSYT